jgi:hypothetical protein
MLILLSSFSIPQVVAQHTVAQQAAQREWTNHSCAALLSGGGNGALLPDGALHSLLSKRMAGSEANAANHQKRKGQSSTRGEPGTMECRGYGPCAVPGLSAVERVNDAQYSAAACGALSVREVLKRMCSRLGIDEAVYFEARRLFEARVRGGGEAQGGERLQELRREGVALERVSAHLLVLPHPPPACPHTYPTTPTQTDRRTLSPTLGGERRKELRREGVALERVSACMHTFRPRHISPIHPPTQTQRTKPQTD